MVLLQIDRALSGNSYQKNQLCHMVVRRVHCASAPGENTGISDCLWTEVSNPASPSQLSFVTFELRKRRELSVSEIDDPIINPPYRCPRDGADRKAIGKPNQASPKRYAISDEELTEQL